MAVYEGRRADRLEHDDDVSSTLFDEAAIYPPQALRGYAFLADGYRGALIGPRGDVSWLCAPRWDSAATFARLVGARGVYGVTPVEEFAWGGYYEPGTLIWRSRWVTTSAIIECREALALPADPHRLVLLRRIEALESEAVVDIVLELCSDFGRRGATLHRQGDTWHLEAGELSARWSGAGEAQPEGDGVLSWRLRLPKGGHHDLVLEISDQALGQPVTSAVAWQSTERAWSEAVPEFDQSAAPRDSRHAYAVLRGLTIPGGGMIAAATLGLPERAEAGRNYDYRYVWLRDQAYAGLAVGAGGPLPLLDEAVAFSTARILEHGDRLAPAYRPDGGAVPAEETLDVPGYPGGKVVVGNWVRNQFQLDSLGELMQLYAIAGRHDHLTGDDVRAAHIVMDAIRKRWQEPDAGVWELQAGWWTHSRLACVAGLRAAAQPGSSLNLVSASELATVIEAETSRRSLGRGAVWQQRPDRQLIDAALLLAPVRGAVPADDRRSQATLSAVTSQLVEDGYVYRYRVNDQPLGQAEGAFLLCGFAMCLAQLAAGNLVEAFRWFERQRAASGPAGLLAEEFDVRQRQLRGNLPQGFVHALLLECSVRLGQISAGGSAA